MTPHPLSRRTILFGGLGLAGVGALSACSGTNPAPGADLANGATIGPVPTAKPSAGQKVVTATLNPKRTTLDLAGTTVDT